MGNSIFTTDIAARVATDKNIRIALAQQSHYYFLHIYFTNYLTYETAPFQREIISLTENEDMPLSVVVAFRNSGKSTIITTSYPIWSILGKQKKKFIVILSQTQRQARQHLLNLRKELENNELLRHDLGPFEPQDDEWGSYGLIIKDHDAKIIAASTEQSIRGLRHKQYRPDLIICDDVEDLNSVKTKESRDKTHQWLVGDIIPAGDTHTKIMVAGNMLHEDSVLMRLIEGIKENKLIGTFKQFPLLDEQGQCLWKAKFPTQNHITGLEKRVGNEAAWHREYLLKIISDSERVVHPKWIQSYDVLPKNLDNYHYASIGIDLAISKEATADYTAMVTGYVYEANGELLVYIAPNPINKRLSFPEAIELAKLTAKSVKLDTQAELCVEEVAYQKAFTQQLEEHGYDVRGIRVGRLDKRERLALTTNLIKNGQILFPLTGCEELIQQLVGFGVEKHDDLADAFSTLILAILARGIPQPVITLVCSDDENDD